MKLVQSPPHRGEDDLDAAEELADPVPRIRAARAPRNPINMWWFRTKRETLAEGDAWVFQGWVAVGPETKGYTCAHVGAYKRMLPRICISQIIRIYGGNTSQPVLHDLTGLTTDS